MMMIMMMYMTLLNAVWRMNYYTHWQTWCFTNICCIPKDGVACCSRLCSLFLF